MKSFITLVVILMCAIPVFAQEETLVGEEFHSGGFGGPEVKIGPLLGTTGVFVGGRGGWIINHTFVIGGGGYGLVNDIPVKDVLFNGQQAYLNFGYGGLHLEYIANSDMLVHYSIQLLVAGGGVQYRERNTDGWDEHNSDAVFVLEPSAAVEINVTSFFRLGLGASYRFVTGTETCGLTNKDLSNATGMITLKFGTF
jgi:hypothetical protein